MANSYYDHTSYPSNGASGSAAAMRVELDTIEAGFDAVEAAIAGAVSSVTKTTVGLGNVDNTSDANKPVSTATQTALDLKVTASAPSVSGALDMNNNNIAEIKTATFNSQPSLATTTGAVTIDWSAAQNYSQAEPTGNITYTFTAPAGICHLQLFIASDGTTVSRTFTWPASVIWIGATWTHTANKKAIINFWYDGTNYYAQGASQV